MTETKQERVFEDEIYFEGGKIAGHWNGESVDELLHILNAIETHCTEGNEGDLWVTYELAMEDLPHAENIPAELEDKTNYPIWACDKKGMCLVGDDATMIESADSIIERYK